MRRLCWYPSLGSENSSYAPEVTSRSFINVVFSQIRRRPDAAPWSQAWNQSCPKRKTPPPPFNGHASVWEG